MTYGKHEEYHEPSSEFERYFDVLPVIDNTVVAYSGSFVIIEDENGQQYTLEAEDPQNNYPIGTTVDYMTLMDAIRID